MESYFVDDWPEHDNGCMTLSVDGEDIPVPTNVRLTGDEDHQDAEGELLFVDIDTDPEKVKEDAYAGKVLVCKTASMPEPPYEDSFIKSYVVTDTNYRSDPEPPAPMIQRVDPTVNTSWNNRWDFGQWSKADKLVKAGGAVAGVIVSNLTYGNLYGLIDRQSFRNPAPVIVVDRKQGDKLVEACQEGKSAKVHLAAQYLKAKNHNFLTFLPGKNYGTDADEYITINTHSDAMNLTQDNGALGLLGVFHYFSQIPQERRAKTLVACVDTRHFIEGFENKNFQHDPYQVFSDVIPKVSVTIGMEHLGEMEGAEDYEQDTIVPTGNPEFSFMKADDNDWCARVLIQAAIDSGLERADVKIDGRPGNAGMPKSLVRAVQASTHRLGCCVIGEAGNWPGAHTQEYTGLKFFSAKKFRDEVATWTQVTSNFMDVDSIVYNIVWSNINTGIRAMGEAEDISSTATEGLLGNVASIFTQVEAGAYDVAARRLEKETAGAIRQLVAEDYDFDRELPGEGALDAGSFMLGGTEIPEGYEALATYKYVMQAIDLLNAKSEM